MSRGSLIEAALTLSLGASLASAQGPAARQAGDPLPAGGNGTIYVGTYARNILVLDEASMRVRDTIKSSVGIPELSLSFDRKRLYVTDPGNERLEIIDLATKKSSGVFTLSHDSTKVRMWGFSLDPKERFVIMLVKAYTKKIDRYEVSKPTLLRYDLAKHAVTDTVPWPRGEEREGAQILFFSQGRPDVLLHDRRRPHLRYEHAQRGRPVGDLQNAVRGRARSHRVWLSL